MNHWAPLRIVTAPTSVHQIAQSRLHLLQAGDPALHISQLVFGQDSGLVAVGTVFQFQQFANLFQTETQPLGRADKVQPGHGIVIITSDTAQGFLRHR